MRVLYDLIHARAAQEWHESINKDNYNRWAKHWVDTAVTIKDEFQSEGLVDTALVLNNIIIEQAKWANVSVG